MSLDDRPRSAGRPAAPRLHAARRAALAAAQAAGVALFAAWLLTKTSPRLLANLPLALAAVLAARWLVSASAFAAASRAARAASRRPPLATPAAHPPPPTSTHPLATPAGLAAADAKWRAAVASPLVEAAWDAFGGAIVQEFVYDSWWSALTPDADFPRIVRASLNALFGEAAAAARRIDVRRLLLGDGAELVMEALTLFRDARDAAVATLPDGAAEWATLSDDAREALLVAEYAAGGNLHPALAPAGPRTGHYAVLRRVAEGVAAAALDRPDFNHPMLRSLVRELLASAVLRPAVGMFAPHSAARLLLAALARSGAAGIDVASLPPGVLPTEPAHSWDFDQRARASVAAEEGGVAARAAAAAVAAAAAATAGHAPLPRTTSDATALLRARRPNGGVGGGAHHNSMPPSPDGRARPLPPSAVARAGGGACAGAPSHRRSVSAGGALLGASDALTAAAAAAVSPPWPAAPPPAAPAYDSDGAASGSRRSASTAASRGPSARERGRDRDRADSRAPPTALPPSPPPLGEGHLLPTGGIPPSGPGGESYFGFLGRPRARVVGADLDTAGVKDVVLFHVRVADGRGEWAVTRRHRHFEALHRALRDAPGYRLRLPSRRAYGPPQTPDAVEERRRSLDAYLWRLLADPGLAARKEVWDFLSAWGAPPPLAPGFLKSAAASLRGASSSAARAAVGGVVAAAGAVGGGAAAAATATARSVGRVGDGVRRRTPSRPRPPPLDVGGGGGGGGASREGSPPPRARASTPGARGGGSAVAALFRGGGSPSPAPRGASARPTPRDSQATTPNASPATSSASGEGGGSRPPSPGPPSPPPPARASPPPPGARAPAGTPAPTPPRPPRPAPVVVPGDENGEVVVVGPAKSRLAAVGGGGGLPPPPPPRPALSPRSSTGAHSIGRSASSPALADDGVRMGPGGSGDGRRPSSAGGGNTPPSGADADADATTPPATLPAVDGGHLAAAPAPQHAPPSSAAERVAVTRAMPPRSPGGGGGADRAAPASLATAPPLPTAAPTPTTDEDWEEVAGASAPLYELVGVVFELHTRGFFRRQVFGVARQALALVAGGAVDDWLLRRLRALSSPTTMAGLLLRLQGSLWPGGVWYSRAAAVAASREREAAGSPQPPLGPDGRPPWRPLTADAFMTPPETALVHAAEVRAALRAALLDGPLPALARIVGRDVYRAGVSDVLDALASPSTMLGLGHAALKALIVTLWPRLKPLYADVEAAGRE